MAKNGKKNINLSNDGNGQTLPPKMEIKLIQKINLSNDGNFTKQQKFMSKKSL